MYFESRESFRIQYPYSALQNADRVNTGFQCGFGTEINKKKRKHVFSMDNKRRMYSEAYNKPTPDDNHGNYKKIKYNLCSVY